MKILGIEVTEKEFDFLFCEQAKGKELKVVDGKVVAVEHEVTQEELKEQRKFEIRQRLEQLSQDLVQILAGAEFVDLKERQLEFQTLHNELRQLEGKEPRSYVAYNDEENTEEIL